MAADPDHGHGSRVAGSLEQLVEELVRRLVPEVLRELAKAAPAEPVWASKAVAYGLGFPAPSTLRAWQAAGVISRGRRGRVCLAELRQVLAGRTEPAAPSELEAARARRAAAAVAAAARKDREP